MLRVKVLIPKEHIVTLWSKSMRWVRHMDNQQRGWWQYKNTKYTDAHICRDGHLDKDDGGSLKIQKHKNTKYTDAYFRDGHMDKDNGGNQGFDSIQEASEEEEGGRGMVACDIFH